MTRYTARVLRGPDTARVTVAIGPTDGPGSVTLAPAVAARLAELFGEHVGHGRACVESGVGGQIAMANVAGEMPRVGRTAFRAEVVAVELDSRRGWEESGYLLTMAAMDATAAFLYEFEGVRAEG